MKLIVDTNVAVVANAAASQASTRCMAQCARELAQVCGQEVLVIDDSWHIIREYQKQLHSVGQPGVGDAFLRWVLTNLANPLRCEMVHITPKQRGKVDCDFEEYPRDQALWGFDPSDRKFVAVAVAHPDHPGILNATDSDWWDYREALASHGVRVKCVCPDAPFLQGDADGNHQL